jgi:hypothetical protein
MRMQRHPVGSTGPKNIVQVSAEQSSEKGVA